jgi:hypothetical protein
MYIGMGIDENNDFVFGSDGLVATRGQSGELEDLHTKIVLVVTPGQIRYAPLLGYGAGRRVNAPWSQNDLAAVRAQLVSAGLSNIRTLELNAPVGSTVKELYVKARYPEQ